MSSKMVINNVSGEILVDGSPISGGGLSPAPGAGYTFLSDSSNQWVEQATSLSWRNRIINGDMSVDQRTGGIPVSITSGSGRYVADRWLSYSFGATQTASVPVSTLSGFSYALRWTGAASATLAGFTQRIESINISDLAEKAVTFSFRIFNGTGSAKTIQIQPAYPSATDNFTSVTYFSLQNIEIPVGWSFQTYTFTLDANCTRGLAIGWQYNALGASQYIDVTGVQLEEGAIATPFEYLPYDQNLAMCQRYYSKISGTTAYGVGCSVTTAQAFIFIKYPQTMRSAPTVTQTTSAILNTLTRNTSSLGTAFCGLDSAGIFVNTSATTQTLYQGVVLRGSVTTSNIDFYAEL